MKRLFTNILTEDVTATADFYVSLFGMRKHFDSDWFVILVHDDMPGHEYGILQRDNQIVPADIRKAPEGCMVTFVVEDCQETFDKAVSLGAKVIEDPADMPYGQRRALVRDPAGTVLDISAPIPS